MHKLETPSPSLFLKQKGGRQRKGEREREEEEKEKEEEKVGKERGTSC